ncbi:hypothetical protein GKE82_23550 [Conexibacter sp. W3-3-2]|uniref:hypothetical protein n=1 Tax=Conexibacter sp. W3-3-2 TaxID=2675227 RepID=UPI0012B71A2A|nr:hypothetical protein [Conexibacter sp. W3-3-2]MTD47181.1 hypothetical protein [Conexibacter sp. W3-3-2]
MTVAQRTRLHALLGARALREAASRHVRLGATESQLHSTTDGVHLTAHGPQHASRDTLPATALAHGTVRVASRSLKDAALAMPDCDLELREVDHAALMLSGAGSSITLTAPATAPAPAMPDPTGRPLSRLHAGALRDSLTVAQTITTAGRRHSELLGGVHLLTTDGTTLLSATDRARVWLDRYPASSTGHDCRLTLPHPIVGDLIASTHTDSIDLHALPDRRLLLSHPGHDLLTTIPYGTLPDLHATYAPGAYEPRYRFTVHAGELLATTTRLAAMMGEQLPERAATLRFTAHQLQLQLRTGSHRTRDEIDCALSASQPLPALAEPGTLLADPDAHDRGVQLLIRADHLKTAVAALAHGDLTLGVSHELQPLLLHSPAFPNGRYLLWPLRPA